MTPERRTVREDEIRVISAALERARVGSIDDAVLSLVSGLRVVGRCECGCASIDFDSPPSDHNPTPIADGTGTTPHGGKVGVIVWGRSDAITGLEIYDLGAGQDDLVLPTPISIRSWDSS
jgi:hypothetical protein